jgi:hypothetical protein
LTKNELNFIKKVRDFFQTLVIAFINTDIDKTKIFFEERNNMFDDILEILYDKNPIISHYFLSILKEMSAIGNFITNCNN